MFQTLPTVRGLVIHTIAVVSGWPENGIGMNDDLHNDLLMSGELRRALAPSFQKIARNVVPKPGDKTDAKNAIITKSECEDLAKVKDAVDLVANGAGVDSDRVVAVEAFV